MLVCVCVFSFLWHILVATSFRLYTFAGKRLKINSVYSSIEKELSSFSLPTMIACCDLGGRVRMRLRFLVSTPTWCALMDMTSVESQSELCKRLDEIPFETDEMVHEHLFSTHSIHPSVLNLMYPKKKLTLFTVLYLLLRVSLFTHLDATGESPRQCSSCDSTIGCPLSSPSAPYCIIRTMIALFRCHMSQKGKYDLDDVIPLPPTVSRWSGAVYEMFFAMVLAGQRMNGIQLITLTDAAIHAERHARSLFDKSA